MIGRRIYAAAVDAEHDDLPTAFSGLLDRVRWRDRITGLHAVSERFELLLIEAPLEELGSAPSPADEGAAARGVGESIGGTGLVLDEMASFRWFSGWIAGSYSDPQADWLLHKLCDGAELTRNDLCALSSRLALQIQRRAPSARVSPAAWIGLASPTVLEHGAARRPGSARATPRRAAAHHHASHR
jgi:hypothetical protein